MSDSTYSMLRPDEKFCIEAVAALVEGQWSEGENPPDAYLRIGNERIAVEISTLTQYVTDQNGGYKPRLSEDLTAIRQPHDEDLHELIAERYEQRATIITSKPGLPEVGPGL